MTYAQGYNKVSRLFFSNTDIQMGFMSTLVGREVLLLLLHMYRFHMFDGRLSSFNSDEELLREAQGLCMDPSRETTRVYCRVSESLSWPRLSFKGVTLVSFLNELASISDEWYEEHFAHLFDDLLLSPDPYGQYVDLPEPQEIQDLIFSLVDINQVHSVYNPFAGLSSFGVNLPASCYYCGQEQISNVYALSLLRLMAHNVTNYEFFNEDCLSLIPWKQSVIIRFHFQGHIILIEFVLLLCHHLPKEERCVFCIYQTVVVHIIIIIDS